MRHCWLKTRLHTVNVQASTSLRSPFTRLSSFRKQIGGPEALTRIKGHLDDVVEAGRNEGGARPIGRDSTL